MKTVELMPIKGVRLAIQDQNEASIVWAKVKIDHSGCWLWIGHVNKVNGYGQFWDGEK